MNLCPVDVRVVALCERHQVDSLRTWGKKRPYPALRAVFGGALISDVGGARGVALSGRGMVGDCSWRCS